MASAAWAGALGPGGAEKARGGALTEERSWGLGKVGSGPRGAAAGCSLTWAHTQQGWGLGEWRPGSSHRRRLCAAFSVFFLFFHRVCRLRGHWPPGLLPALGLIMQLLSRTHQGWAAPSSHGFELDSGVMEENEDLRVSRLITTCDQGLSV